MTNKEQIGPDIWPVTTNQVTGTKYMILQYDPKRLWNEDNPIYGNIIYWSLTQRKLAIYI